MKKHHFEKHWNFSNNTQMEYSQDKGLSLSPPSSSAGRVNMFSVLPQEIIQLIFSFLSIKDLSYCVKPVCKIFHQLTDVRSEKQLWKLALERDWHYLSKGNSISERLSEIGEIQWSIQERGYFNIAKTLCYQISGKQDKDWVIILKKNGEEMIEGRLIDNKLEGRCRHVFGYGHVYEGEWKQNKREGRGTVRSKNGDVYEGQWVADTPHGKGKWKSINGFIYEGEWKQGKAEGKGTCYYSNGNMYEGEWKNDCMHGKGISMWAGGRNLSR